MALVFSAISAYFYLRLVRYMYMEDPQEEFTATYSPGLTTSLAISTLGVIGIGILLGSLLSWAAQSLIGL